MMHVQDLVSTPSLGLTVLAGDRGTHREVLWAHSCELQNPEQWLGPHELLMTVGLCIPPEPEAQVRFIARLDEAGLAGIVVGEHEPLPELSNQMIQEANERHFPLLMATRSVPFAVLARHVAAAHSSQHILQVLTLSKMYRLASSGQDKTADELLTELSSLLQVGLRVVDTATGMTIAASKMLQAESPQQDVRSLPIGDNDGVELYLYEYPTQVLESFLLVHLLQILEVLVERTTAALNKHIHDASHTVARILAAERTEQFQQLLQDYPEADGYRMVVCAESDYNVLARAIALKEVPTFVGSGRSSTLALVPYEIVPELRVLVERMNIRSGVSSIFTDYRDIRIAVDEAARVLSASTSHDAYWAEFEGSTVGLFVRSRHESEEIVQTVLGTLAGHSASIRKLRTTLFAFLSHDRRWQETADALGIHRQTLSYRLHRIEEETGLSLSKSADFSAVWIAYQAWGNLHGEQY